MKVAQFLGMMISACLLITALPVTAAPLSQTSEADQQLMNETLDLQERSIKSNNKPWTLGLGISGGLVMVGGVTMIGVASRQWQITLDRYGQYAGTNPSDWNIASSNLLKTWKLYGAGAGLIGAGVGFGLGAIGMHFEPRVAKPKLMWGLGAGFGGALVITGALLEGLAGARIQNTQWSHRDHFTELTSAARNDYTGDQHRVGASVAVLGLGAGVALSSVIALIRGARNHKSSFVPTGTGIAWVGTF